MKKLLDDLTSDTPRTPVAANRVKKFIARIGPAAGSVLQKLVENTATEAAKKSIGL